MKIKKSGLILLFLFLISILVVSCSEDKNDDSSLSKLLKGAVDKAISVGQLKFLGKDKVEGAKMIGFMRIMIGILVFAILFGIGSHFLPDKRNIVMVIAGIFAIISVMYIPPKLLAGIGGAYGAVVAFVMIGIPVLGGGFLLYKIPSDEKWQIALKMAIIALLIWILIAVKTYARSLAGI